MKRHRRVAAACAAWIVVGTSGLAVGEEPTTAPSEPPPATSPEIPVPAEPTTDDVSDDELRALEAALQADAEQPSSAREASDDGAAPTVASTSGPAGANQVALDIAFILDVAGAWFSAEEPLQLGAHDPTVTGFNFQQLELSLGASVDPYFRFDANLVFALFGVEIEEAYASTLSLPANLKVRAGLFLTQFGRLNATHPHSWSFVDQPIVNGKFFGSEGSRGLGTELSWLSPLPWYVDVIGAVTMADGECCARSFYGGDNLGVRTPADLLYTTRVEQFFPLSDTLSLLWGISAQFGPNSTGLGNRSEIYGTDLYLRYRPLQSTSRMALSLQLEGMLRTRQVPDDVLQDFGGRGELVWSMTPRWETGARYELVTGVEDDPLDPDWVGERQRISAQATFYPSHFSRLRLQPSVDLPSWFEDPVYAVMLSLEVLVGAHGAHEY